jgi:hypothetical protein
MHCKVITGYHMVFCIHFVDCLACCQPLFCYTISYSVFIENGPVLSCPFKIFIEATPRKHVIRLTLGVEITFMVSVSIICASQSLDESDRFPWLKQSSNGLQQYTCNLLMETDSSMLCIKYLLHGIEQSLSCLIFFQCFLCRRK